MLPDHDKPKGRELQIDEAPVSRSKNGAYSLMTRYVYVLYVHVGGSGSLGGAYSVPIVQSKARVHSAVTLW